MRIQCSDSTAHLLKKVGTFQLECRGTLDIKGKGTMTTWWLLGETRNNASPLSVSSSRYTPNNKSPTEFSLGTIFHPHKPSSPKPQKSPSRVTINLPGTPS